MPATNISIIDPQNKVVTQWAWVSYAWPAAAWDIYELSRMWYWEQWFSKKLLIDVITKTSRKKTWVDSKFVWNWVANLWDQAKLLAEKLWISVNFNQ
jgi:hypothetical protein